MKLGMKIAKMADWIDKGKTPEIVFGTLKLKNMQKAIINCLNAYDVVANLPTGFGKSLLFQYPASRFKSNEECALVIVPLKALLWDTIREARALGITCEELDNRSINAYYQTDSLPQILVATPEKIFGSEMTFSFLESLHRYNKIKLLVIDECHCISQWGHDFRPAYLRLSQLRSSFQSTRLLAISATISSETRVDLSDRLSVMSGYFFQASYHRPNLFYGVIPCQGPSQFQETIIHFLKQQKLENCSGIVYCQTIAGAQKLAKSLTGFKTGLFHSKQSEKMRKQIYDDFMDQKVKMIIGTICFGMGINKKNIRYVINLGVSKSPENYYQQSGRAGRDGLKSFCIIISFPAQINSLSFLIGNSGGTAKQKKHQLLKLNQMKQYTDEKIECRRQNLFRKLGQNFPAEGCNRSCDNCCLDKSSVRIAERDFYIPVMKIVDDLQSRQVEFTKKQLCAFLKGKSVTVKRKNKEKQLELGEQTRGIFKAESPLTIEKIVEKMMQQNLLVANVKKFRSKFAVTYLRVANQNVTRRCKQFILTTLEDIASQKTIKKDKFSSYLNIKQKNDGSTLQNRDLQSSTQFIAQKVEQQQLKEAQIIKQKVDYTDFLMELFGDEVNMDSEHQQIDNEDEDVIMMNDSMEEELEQMEKRKQSAGRGEKEGEKGHRQQQQQQQDTISLSILQIKNKIKREEEKRKKLKRLDIDFK